MKNKNIEVSVVMPCLNEEETLGICIQKAQRTLDALGIVGEVVIADNGSTDASAEIAERLGASVVHNLHAGTVPHTLQDLQQRKDNTCLLYTSPSPRDRTRSRMPSSA